MPETYNPRDRSFIKMPEIKTCITCGQILPSDIKPMSTHMNKYVNIISGREVAMNSNEDTVEVQGVKLYRNTTAEDKAIVAKLKGNSTAKVAAPPAPPKVVEVPKSPILNQSAGAVVVPIVTPTVAGAIPPTAPLVPTPK